MRRRAARCRANGEAMKTFCVSYMHGGKPWGLEIVAEDWVDAVGRLRALGHNGIVDGELIAAVPAVAGWWIPLVCRVRNLFAVKP